MNLPPLIDGAFVIDNSTLEKWKCPYAFSMRDRVPANARAGANFGSTIHRGLETRYKLAGTKPLSPAQQVLCNSAMHEWLTENPQPEMDFRNYAHAEKFLAVYNKIYPQESWQIVKTAEGKEIIESSFCLPFGVCWPNGHVTDWPLFPLKFAAIKCLPVDAIPLYYSGKIDLCIRDSNGIWSFDHKTAFQFGDTFDQQMGRDGGQLGYCWALEQTLGIRPCGYIIDAMRVRKPSRASEFTGAAPIDGTDFKRIPNWITPDQLAEWKENVLAIIGDIFASYRRGFFPQHRWQCTNKYGACDYIEVCTSGKTDRARILASGLFEDNKWTMGLKTNKQTDQTKV
jgi:hypothetical protein